MGFAASIALALQTPAPATSVRSLAWALVAMLLMAAPVAGAALLAPPERVGLFLLVETKEFSDLADGRQYTYHGPRDWSAIIHVHPTLVADQGVGSDPIAAETNAVRVGLARLQEAGAVSHARVIDERRESWDIRGQPVSGVRLALAYRRDGHDRQGFVYVLAPGSEIVKIRLIAVDGKVKPAEAKRFVELVLAAMVPP
jgi:hypothetical protein